MTSAGRDQNSRGNRPVLHLITVLALVIAERRPTSRPRGSTASSVSGSLQSWTATGCRVSTEAGVEVDCRAELLRRCELSRRTSTVDVRRPHVELDRWHRACRSTNYQACGPEAR